MESKPSRSDRPYRPRGRAVCSDEMIDAEIEHLRSFHWNDERIAMRLGLKPETVARRRWGRNDTAKQVAS
jgi:hypothetical protein